MQRLRIVLSALLVVCLRAAPDGQAPVSITPDSSFEFRPVVQGTVVEHAFVLHNPGSHPLRIRGVNLTPPILLKRMPAQIEAGQDVPVQVRIDTAHLTGVFEGNVEISLDDPEHSLVNLTISGSILPRIELSPMAAFYVAGTRGKGGQGTIDVINHDDEPLQLGSIEHTSTRFRVRAETVEEGKHYRLVLEMSADGPGGKATEVVQVHTSNSTQPLLRIVANTNLTERVYTFPDVVDLGSIPIAALKADPTRFAQTLMIYQQEGTDFAIRLSTDAPFSVHTERGPRGDRWQVTLTIDPARAQPGPITGSIVIQTNDPQFSMLSVPVAGTIRP